MAASVASEYSSEIASTAIRRTPEPPKIMMLMGPVGPFFLELYDALKLRGVSVQRVVFNAGDALFSNRKECVNFSGGVEEWESWLRSEFSQHKPDIVVLFGSSRPAHKIARHIAPEFDVEVLSLEEGYLRTGYITCEVGGNNQHSPLTAWLGEGRCPSSAGLFERPPFAGRFPVLFKSIWAATHYLIRDTFSERGNQELFHRKREHPVILALSWASHLIRRWASKVSEAPTIAGLHQKLDYILVPLQVATDSQLSHAARGWDSSSLIDACIQASAKLDGGPRIVFKLHPLERGGGHIKREILRRAKLAGLEHGAVTVISSGRIGDLTQHSSGMVVINSTSAFSALHYDVPVLVLGDAVYRHHAIVTLGDTESDVSNFFKTREPKNSVAVQEFIEHLKAESLLPGDFYAQHARQVAVDGIVEKIGERLGFPLSKNGATNDS